MTNSEIAFMALAEELNFTRAAERIFMSQQGLSDHIKRLEAEYDTQLVTRRPEVTLTDSGAVVYNMLLTKKVMELDVHRMIADINHGNIGDVRIGISSSRTGIFTGKIISRFYELHPKIHLNIVSGMTASLMQMLYEGKLDFVIGVNPPQIKGLHIEQLFDDKLYIAVPKHIAVERTGNAECVDIRSYQDLPFIRDLQESNLGYELDRFLAKQNISLNTIINSNDYNEKAELCVVLDAAMFCTKTFTCSMARKSLGEKLQILEIDGLNHSVTVCLITSGQRAYPKCVTDMIEISRDSIRQFYDENIVSNQM